MWFSGIHVWQVAPVYPVPSQEHWKVSPVWEHRPPCSQWFGTHLQRNTIHVQKVHNSMWSGELLRSCGSFVVHMKGALGNWTVAGEGFNATAASILPVPLHYSWSFWNTVGVVLLRNWSQLRVRSIDCSWVWKMSAWSHSSASCEREALKTSSCGVNQWHQMHRQFCSTAIIALI